MQTTTTACFSVSSYCYVSYNINKDRFILESSLDKLTFDHLHFDFFSNYIWRDRFFVHYLFRNRLQHLSAKDLICLQHLCIWLSPADSAQSICPPIIMIIYANDAHKIWMFTLNLASNDVPPNTRRWADAVLMLGHRLRRRPNIKPALAQRFLFFLGCCYCSLVTVSTIYWTSIFASLAICRLSSFTWSPVAKRAHVLSFYSHCIKRNFIRFTCRQSAS